MQLERNGGMVVWAVTKRTVDQKARISFSSILGSFILKAESDSDTWKLPHVYEGAAESAL